jgi:hypothetical protein
MRKRSAMCVGGPHVLHTVKPPKVTRLKRTLTIRIDGILAGAEPSDENDDAASSAFRRCLQTKFVLPSFPRETAETFSAVSIATLVRFSTLHLLHVRRSCCSAEHGGGIETLDRKVSGMVAYAMVWLAGSFLVQLPGTVHLHNNHSDLGGPWFPGCKSYACALKTTSKSLP